MSEKRGSLAAVQEEELESPEEELLTTARPEVGRRASQTPTRAIAPVKSVQGGFLKRKRAKGSGWEDIFAVLRGTTLSVYAKDQVELYPGSFRTPETPLLSLDLASHQLLPLDEDPQKGFMLVSDETRQQHRFLAKNMDECSFWVSILSSDLETRSRMMEDLQNFSNPTTPEKRRLSIQQPLVPTTSVSPTISSSPSPRSGSNYQQLPSPTASSGYEADNFGSTPMISMNSEAGFVPIQIISPCAGSYLDNGPQPCNNCSRLEQNGARLKREIEVLKAKLEEDRKSVPDESVKSRKSVRDADDGSSQTTNSCKVCEMRALGISAWNSFRADVGTQMHTDCQLCNVFQRELTDCKGQLDVLLNNNSSLQRRLREFASYSPKDAIFADLNAQLDAEKKKYHECKLELDALQSHVMNKRKELQSEIDSKVVALEAALQQEHNRYLAAQAEMQRLRDNALLQVAVERKQADETSAVKEKSFQTTLANTKLQNAELMAKVETLQRQLMVHEDENKDVIHSCQRRLEEVANAAAEQSETLRKQIIKERERNEAIAKENRQLIVQIKQLEALQAADTGRVAHIESLKEQLQQEREKSLSLLRQTELTQKDLSSLQQAASHERLFQEYSSLNKSQHLKRSVKDLEEILTNEQAEHEKECAALLEELQEQQIQTDEALKCLVDTQTALEKERKRSSELEAKVLTAEKLLEIETFQRAGDLRKLAEIQHRLASHNASFNRR